MRPREVPLTRWYKAADEIEQPLRFGRPNVLRLLGDWKAHRITDEQVRWWALLVFIGAFPQDWSPTGWLVRVPLREIDFDYSDDEAVNEAVYRLKDLRDDIDGEISSAECDQLIISLIERDEDYVRRL